MEDEDVQQSTVEEPVTSVATGVSPQGVIGLLAFALLASIVLRRLGRSNLASGLRRWLPVLYTALWGGALLSITVMYARGLSQTAFAGVLVLFLLTALASIGWLRSVMAGVAISLEGRINLGDSIRIGGLSGEVMTFGVRSLTLRAVDGSLHEIPNEKLVVESVTNLSGDGGDSATEFVIPVPPNVDPEHAVQVARDVAILTPLASPRHQPEVFLESGAAVQQYEIRVRGYAFDAAYQDHFRSDVVARLQSEFSTQATSEEVVRVD